jgi:hypothetical protein
VTTDVVAGEAAPDSREPRRVIAVPRSRVHDRLRRRLQRTTRSDRRRHCRFWSGVDTAGSRQEERQRHLVEVWAVAGRGPVGRTHLLPGRARRARRPLRSRRGPRGRRRGSGGSERAGRRSVSARSAPPLPEWRPFRTRWPQRAGARRRRGGAGESEGQVAVAWAGTRTSGCRAWRRCGHP